tara:strand:+ start:12689 stop:12994 length:306 start_codon:yes stop_codon:yes gene_type:complete
MSNNFQLIDNKTNEAVAVNQIDKEICDLLDVDVHPKFYGGDQYNWFNTIGFQIAMGKPLGSEELRDYITDTSPNGWSKEWAEMGKTVLDYLESTYTSKAWA